MLKETRQLLTKSSIYSIGNILIKLVAFLLIPLYARKLAPDEYGVVAILELLELLGKPLLGLGLSQSILRFLNQYKSKNKADELVFTNLIFLFVFNLIFLGSLYIYPDFWVRQFLSLTPENIVFFRYILLIIFFGMFQGIFVVLLQAEEKAFSFVVFTLIHFLLLLGLNIYKVGILNQGVLGIVESKLYVGILSFSYIMIYFIKRFRLKFSRGVLSESLQYGLPLIFVGVSLTLLTLADRYFLKIFRNMTEVGIYSMSYRFGMIMNMVLITPFRQAFSPMMFRLADEMDIKKLYRKYFTYFLLAGFIFFLFLSMFAREILLIVTTPEYAQGAIIIPLITFAYLLFGLRSIFTNALATMKKTKIIALTTILGALLNIILNMILIPQMGILGAAIATVVSYFVITIFNYFPLQKIYPIPWDWPRALKIITIGFFLYGLSFLIKIDNIFISMALKFVLLVVYPVLLYYFGFFHQTELEQIGIKLRGKENEKKPSSYS